jgi:hypothetical protein
MRYRPGAAGMGRAWLPCRALRCCALKARAAFTALLRRSALPPDRCADQNATHYRDGTPSCIKPQDTIQDLSKLKLSPEQQLRRKLERVSRHQLLVASVTAGDLAAAAAAERGLGGARRYAARRSWGGRGGVDAGSSGAESEGGEGGGDDGRERRAFGRQSQRDGGAWPPPRDQQARCGSSGGYEEAKGPGVDRRPDQRRNDSWRRHCAGSDRGDRGEDADWSDGGESDGGEGAEAEEVWGERVSDAPLGRAAGRALALAAVMRDCRLVLQQSL